MFAVLFTANMLARCEGTHGCSFYCSIGYLDLSLPVQMGGARLLQAAATVASSCFNKAFNLNNSGHAEESRSPLALSARASAIGNRDSHNT